MAARHLFVASSIMLSRPLRGQSPILFWPLMTVARGLIGSMAQLPLSRVADFYPLGVGQA